ncbi:transcriptional regulator [Salinimicrobium marinum]|uniref:Transcriptional regulator n=1 Tax=Salinimicrobium marinum TaxID=680283 RepID=A0A918SAW4_9FLAO|nr:helix-turn-helix transcriptional regulator [Salinimicrobium marinum]GHA31665.1 transcriptional regulator [Salinimicrobium marinum]
MVNTEQFTKRLHKIMEYYDLSAASFADKIDVGRSSISHLLSGRNKPSLDFVMKIINAFPEVELYWLLNGKGNFPAKENIGSSANSEKAPSAPSNNLFTESLKENSQSPMPPEERKTQGKKEIKKIVFFYTDGSFEAFDH